MEFILVSSCLLGQAVRHDGGHKRCDHEVLQRWIQEKRVVSICPEFAGGLAVPRAAAEITGGAGGLKVLAGLARVVDTALQDVSAEFVDGAHQALQLAQSRQIKIAVLKEGSPSCGTGFTYDGTFSGKQVGHPGVTAALLQQAGIYVFSEHELPQADALLKGLEARHSA